MAYLPFPSTWPLFTPKDKIGDWFEAYASLLELNVWMNARVDSAEYDDKTGEWLVMVERGGQPKRQLRPRHVVMCTGMFPMSCSVVTSRSRNSILFPCFSFSLAYTVGYISITFRWALFPPHYIPNQKKTE